MAEIGLKELEKDASQPLTRLVSKLCCGAAGVSEVHGFPGTLPLTLSRRHLDMICHNDYVLLEKSDGTRYFLLILEVRVGIAIFKVLRKSPHLYRIKRSSSTASIPFIPLFPGLLFLYQVKRIFQLDDNIMKHYWMASCVSIWPLILGNI